MQTPTTDDFAQASPNTEDDLKAYAPFKSAGRIDDYNAIRCWATTFYPFQREWLFDPSRFAIACKSRQIGYSHTSAALAVLWSAMHGEMTTIISKSEVEAFETLAKCVGHARVLHRLGSSNAAMHAVSTQRIQFASGGRIMALPSTGGRSFSGNVILDEFAYQLHAEETWDAAAPVASLAGYRIRVISTPNGAGNSYALLWEQAQKKESIWSTHRVPVYRAIEEGLDIDLQAAWEFAKRQSRLFEQMYNCSFIDAVLQYFSSDDIDPCRTRAVLLPDDDGLYYAGLDVGRSVDLTVLTVLLMKNGIMKLVHVEEMERTDSAGLKAMIKWAYERYKIRRLCIDGTGLGTFVADDIKEEYGDRIEVPHRRNKVEVVQFTMKTKEELATSGYSAFTAKAIMLPDSDAQLPSFERWNKDSAGHKVGPPIVVNKSGTAYEIRKELASIQRTVTPSGNVTYDSPRTSTGHGDRAWSLLLAIRAVDKKNPMIAALQARMQGPQPST